MSSREKMPTPTFIHSLFRAGSTYIFSVFRRSKAGYWCFQEPLHELSYFCRENPQGLQEDHGDEKTQLLRHPKIDSNYFAELIEVWPAWKGNISEQAVYSAYFAPPNQDFGIEFWQSLIKAAKGRPIFQECRTSGRINAIKESIGGTHLYLWRNPWDQWWSYKINNYFNTANQLIIHGENAPAPLKLMLRELELPRYTHHDISGSFSFYAERPLTSEQSYLVFYMLWCLAFKEALNSADLLLNIDRLSDSEDYQKDICAKMQALNIDGIDFSDCRVPQGIYTVKDNIFFAATEARVHNWLIEGGWQGEDLKIIQNLRSEYEPNIWRVPLSKLNPVQIVEQLDRFQEMARRFETANAENAKGTIRVLEESCKKQVEAARFAHNLETQAKEAAERERLSQVQLNLALTTVQQAQELAKSLKNSLSELNKTQENTRQELVAAHQANHHHWQLADQRQQQINALYASRSWRITAPLRWPANQYRLLSQYGFKKRLNALAIKILKKTNSYLRANPTLRKILLVLSQTFGVYKPLKTLRDRLHAHPVTSFYVESPYFVGDSQDFDHLTSRARQIYFELKESVARNQKG